MHGLWMYVYTRNSWDLVVGFSYHQPKVFGAESEVVMQIGISKAAETEGMSTPPHVSTGSRYLQRGNTRKREPHLPWLDNLCLESAKHRVFKLIFLDTSGNGWNFSKKIYPSIRNHLAVAVISKICL